MSSTIWTRCGGKSSTSPLAGRAWRVVEAQHVVSTRALVDTLEEQALLEDLLEEQKPPLPDEPVFAGLHPLLATPFRYPPLSGGSRFGQRHERGLWYGSTTIPTALAEVAYHRLLFLAGTTADISPVAELTAFQAGYASAVGIDATRPPFDAFAAEISSPTDYRAAQELGSDMRDAGVEAIVYWSARAVEPGTNTALLTPRAFSPRRPGRELSTWVCYASRGRIDFLRKNLVSRRETFSFERSAFEVDGALPAPALAS